MSTNPNVLYSGDFWTGFAQTPTPTPIVVTFSFPTSLPSFDDNPPNAGFTQATVNSFTPFTAAEQAQAISALSEWASASQVIFVQVAPGQGDINFSNVDFSTLSTPSTDAGIGYNPFGEWNSYSGTYGSSGNFTTDKSVSGSIFMNSEYLSDGNNADSTVAYETLLHEIGHAIGLKHPNQTDDDYSTGIFEDNTAADDPNLTVMATTGDDSGAGAGHLKALDIAAAASIYGSPGGGAAGTPTGPGEVITDTVSGGTTTFTATTWDSGTETESQTNTTAATFSGSNSVSSWTWNPTTQTLTQTAAAANDVIHGTSVNDVIYAGSGTDSLFGLDGDNTLYGGSLSTSVDTFYGGPDADTLYGGASGTNTFYAGAGTESMVGGGPSSTNTFYDGTYDGFGSGGTDYMIGDGATDNFYVGSASTSVTEDNPLSNATVYATVSYTLPQYVDTLYLYSGGLTGTGNDDAHNTMYGSGAGPNTLIAGTGADYMVGGPDNDTFDAGPGGDSMYGQAGANTFTFQSIADTGSYIGDFNLGTDTIDLSGIAKTYGQPLTFIGDAPFTAPGQVQTLPDGSDIEVNVDTAATGVVDFQVVVYNGGAPLTASNFDLACYCAGTLISTERGEIPVEHLAIGDRVRTSSGALRPIRWLGHRRIDCSHHPDPPVVWPVRIGAGALAQNQPARDLWLSPGHSILVDGVLVPAVLLVNGATIAQLPRPQVEYWHVELDSHDVILAEGLPAESYLDTGNRTAFVEGGDFLQAHPDFSPKPCTDTCLPLVLEGPAVQRASAAIVTRAQELGYTITADADVHVVADGKRIDAVSLGPTRLAFMLPAGTSKPELRCRSFVPAHVDAASADHRSLGICIGRLQLDGLDVPLQDDLRFASGWHGLERDTDGWQWRWSQNRVPLPAGTRLVVIELCGPGFYWVPPVLQAMALCG